MSAPVRVLVTPRDENPYQRLLYEAVTRPRARRSATRTVRADHRRSTCWLLRCCWRRIGSVVTAYCTSTGCSSSRCRGPAERGSAPGHAVVVLVLPLVRHMSSATASCGPPTTCCRTIRSSSTIGGRVRYLIDRADAVIALSQAQRERSGRARRTRCAGDSLRLLRRAVPDHARARGGEDSAGLRAGRRRRAPDRQDRALQGRRSAFGSRGEPAVLEPRQGSRRRCMH